MNTDEKKEAKLKKCEELLTYLGIRVAHKYSASCPYSGYVNVDDICTIFLDEEKLKVLVSKLRNKVFW
jgi:hypothetical protein